MVACRNNPDAGILPGHRIHVKEKKIVKISRKLLITGIAVTGLAALGGSTALAVTEASASTPVSPPVSIYGCDDMTHNRMLDRIYTVQGNFKGCPAGSFAVTVASGNTGPAGPRGAQGPAGATGPAGPAGATGAQGPSGVVSTQVTDLGAVASVPTGGSFVSRATEAGTVSLNAGTYLINVNAKATPDVSSAIEVFPQFFIYNQAKNASFTGDLFNVGSGPLASNSTTIDSYYSGTDVITLTQDTTLYVYAFGYDSDQSAGTYALDDLTITATQITAS